MQDCVSHHALCKSGSGALRLPSRLIYIRPSTTDEAPLLSLYVVGLSSTFIKYTTLSHCWGGSNHFKLLSGNYESCLGGINFHHLPKNMQDAVKITLRLGFSYTWIDSLCIIQDSEEDWKAEVLIMGDVYAASRCSIASDAAASSDGGCFHSRDNSMLQPCEIGVSSLSRLLPDMIYMRQDDYSAFHRSVDRSPLNRRGWVVQERVSITSNPTLRAGYDLLGMLAAGSL